MCYLQGACLTHSIHLAPGLGDVNGRHTGQQLAELSVQASEQSIKTHQQHLAWAQLTLRTLHLKQVRSHKVLNTTHQQHLAWAQLTLCTFHLKQVIVRKASNTTH